MTWLVIGGGLVSVIVAIVWTAVRVGRARDPYASLGPVLSHRQFRPDLRQDHHEDC